ncbi:hypothetical protein [Cryobacterium sp. AP23]
MTERSYPFVYAPGSTTSQGATTDAEFSAMFRHAFETGVVGVASGSDLRAYGNSTGLKVMVPGGAAFVRGHYYSSSAVETLVILGGGSQPRIDSVILKLEYGSVNRITLQIKQGTPSSNPKPATLAQTATGVFELLLATVAVAANAATITAANVTPKRTFSGSGLLGVTAICSTVAEVKALPNPFDGKTAYCTDDLTEYMYRSGGWVVWNRPPTAYTPRYTDFTLGNGTCTGRYSSSNGRNVSLDLSLRVGSTTGFGSAPLFRGPVDFWQAPGPHPVGSATMVDSSTGRRLSAFVEQYASYMRVCSFKADGSFLGSDPISRTSPFTWANGDSMQLQAAGVLGDYMNA